MKKFAIVILSLIGLLVLLALAAGFILPYFVSVDDYREEISAEFEKSTGYQIEFDKIELSVFPTVHASASNVNISNGSKTIAQIASVSAFADPMKLIKGEFEIDSIEVNSPNITYEKYKVGNNWAKKEAVAVEGAGEGNSAKQKTEFSIDKISVVDGSFKYDDNIAAKSYKVEKINITSSLTSLQNPILAEGGFEFGGGKFEFEGELKDLEKQEFSVKLNGEGTAISFAGNAKSGAFEIVSSDVNKLAALVGMQDSVKLPQPDLNAKGSFSLGENSNVFDIEKLAVGSSSGTGKVAVQADGKIIADIKMDKLVVEDFVAENAETAGGSGAASRSNNGSAPLPSDLNLRLSLRAQEFKYEKLNLANFDLQVAANNGELVLQPLSFNFENGGVFEIFGVYNQPTAERQVFEGKVQASGKDLQSILRSLDIDAASLNPNQLKNFSVNTNIFVTLASTNKIDLSGLQISMGDKKFSGSMGIVMTNGLPQVTVRGGIDLLNMDSLFAEKKIATTISQQKAQAKDTKNLHFDWLKTLPANMNIALQLNEVILNKERYRNLKFLALAKPGSIEVQNFSVAAMGTQFSGKVQLDARNARAFISTNLNVGFLTLEATEKSQIARSSSQANSAGVSSRWSDEPISFSPLDEFDADFNVQIQGLRQGDLRFENIRMKSNLQNAKLNVSDLTAQAFGGQMSVVGTVGVGVVPDFNLKIVGEGMDMRQVASQLANNKDLSGLMNVRASLSSSGGSESALIQNLKGATAFAGTNIIVNGFDLESFVRQLTNIRSPLEVGLMATKVLNGSGQTLITSLQGNVGLDKGIANTQGIALQTRVGLGLFKGNLNLPRWNMDTNATFTIDLGDEKERPKVGVRMFGPIDNFKKDYDYSEVISYYSKRFGAGGTIGNIIGDFLSPR